MIMGNMEFEIETKYFDADLSIFEENRRVACLTPDDLKPGSIYRIYTRTWCANWTEGRLTGLK